LPGQALLQASDALLSFALLGFVNLSLGVPMRAFEPLNLTDQPLCVLVHLVDEIAVGLGYGQAGLVGTGAVLGQLLERGFALLVAGLGGVVRHGAVLRSQLGHG